MFYSNQISTEIADKDLQEIQKAIDFINHKLSGLVMLSDEQIAALPKLRRNTVDFVYDCLAKAEACPDLVPSDVQVDEIYKDVKLINSILKILDPLMDVVKKLEDSALLAGSEAYLPSLAIHNSMKVSKKMDLSLEPA